MLPLLVLLLPMLLVVLDKLLLLLLSILLGLDLRLEMDRLELLLDLSEEMLGQEMALRNMLISNRKVCWAISRKGCCWVLVMNWISIWVYRLCC